MRYENVTMTFRPEDIDLAELVAALQRTFAGRPPTGYLLGRTAFRDALVSHLGCSLLQAEELVDTLVSQGYLTYPGELTERVDDLEPWQIVREPIASAR